MLKHLMSGGSLLSYAVYDAESEAKAAKEAARAELLKNTIVGDPPKKEGEENPDPDEEDEEEEDEENPDPDAELTEEEKATKVEAEKKAAAEAKIVAKAERKQNRMQARIDEAIAAKSKAEKELADFKTANPDTKFTAEEVEAKAEALSAQKLAAKEVANLQAEFDTNCAKIQKAATKINATFDDDIADIAEQFGPLPSFMLGVLFDMDNGDEILAMISKDDNLAEEIYDLKSKPAKMTKKLVELSTKLETEKKAKTKKQISKVPAPPEQVQGRNVQSLTITQADTKDMNSFVAKRRRQQEEYRKAKGN